MIVRVKTTNFCKLLRKRAMLHDVNIESVTVHEFRRAFGNFTDNDDCKERSSTIGGLHIIDTVKF